MAKFRKKPVVIEAFKVSEAIDVATSNFGVMPDWLRNAYDGGKVLFCSDHVVIQTLEGEHRGNFDDWIIQGVAGELYPCKPDIFAATYDPVDD